MVSFQEKADLDASCGNHSEPRCIPGEISRTCGSPPADGSEIVTLCVSRLEDLKILRTTGPKQHCIGFERWLLIMATERVSQEKNDLTH